MMSLGGTLPDGGVTVASGVYLDDDAVSVRYVTVITSYLQL